MDAVKRWMVRAGVVMAAHIQVTGSAGTGEVGVIERNVPAWTCGEFAFPTVAVTTLPSAVSVWTTCGLPAPSEMPKKCTLPVLPSKTAGSVILLKFVVTRDPRQ